MRLKRLTIENFRGYRHCTDISFADFTSIVGRNDVGKSTLLEALDIFFNGRNPDPDDAHVQARDRPTRIRCEFDGLPDEIVIDANAATTLSDEHLLNESGCLEIEKEFNLGASKISAKIYANALH